MRSVAEKASKGKRKKPLRGNALLRFTWNFIASNPAKHDQSIASGTKKCFMGWIRYWHGLEYITPAYSETLARKIGVSQVHVRLLYNGSNTLSDLRRLVIKFTGSSRGLLPLSKQSRAAE